jgi:hypothetical protein
VARKKRAANKNPPMELQICAMLHKCDDSPWSEDELNPIKELEVVPRAFLFVEEEEEKEERGRRGKGGGERRERREKREREEREEKRREEREGMRTHEQTNTLFLFSSLEE